MKNKIPSYFYSKTNSWWLVVGTALYLELFILIFEPFRSRVLVNNDWEYLLWTTIVVGIFMAVIGISRLLMHYYGKKRGISIVAYAFWIFIEVSVITLIFSLMLMLVFWYVAKEYEWTFFVLFKDILLGTAFTLLMPYTILLLSFAYVNAKNEVVRLNGLSDQKALPDMYHFYDERGELKLSVRPEMVYYIESADNYVTIYYINGAKLDKLMIRNTLKNIEWRFRDKGLVRCHRSYIINIRRVSVIRKQDCDVVVDFTDERVPAIPVSKGYNDLVMQYFSVN
ncbi:MAG: LytTR family transcriptional regulator [Paludibacteraceae bacterium]|nr:LytTR family transcriptional regulator [Paludibacteraceae bacterium]